MALVLYDRVRETTAVLGTNDAVLLGAVTGYQSFAVVGNANTCYYTIADSSGNWEVGLGTYSTVGPTLARTTILSSSNSGSKVRFPAGTKDVFLTYPAEKAVTEAGALTSGRVTYATTNGQLNDNANLTFDGTTLTSTGFAGPLNGTVGASTPNTGAFTTLSATGAITVNTTTNNQSYTTTGAGVITISSGTTGTINNFNIGGTTAGTGKFSSVTDTGLTSGRVTYASTGGLLADSANLTFDGTYLVANSIKDSALTSGRVTYAGASGLLQDSANLTFDGTTLTAANITSSGTWTISGGTANGVAYLNGSKVLTTGSAITFDGTNFATTGTASATKLIPTGGTATGNGMYLSTTNTLAWSTNGSQAMTLDASGRLLVGTTSNIGSFDMMAVAGANATANDLTLYGPSTSQVRLTFSKSGANGVGEVGYNMSTDVLRFVTASNERMRIDSSGNVGIGTSSPTSMLHLSSASSPTIQVIDTTNNATAVVSSGNTEVYFGTTSNHPSVFLTNNTERMRIDSSGNVGIGNTSPATYQVGTSMPTIVLQGTSGSYPNRSGGMCFVTQNGTTGKTYVYQDTDFAIHSATATNITFLTNNTERMRIDSSGSVGIGTNSPAFSDGSGVHLQRAGVATYRTYNSSSSAAGEFRADATGTAIDCRGLEVFRVLTGGAERMRIDSSGYLLVGYTSSNGAYKLQVNSQIFATNATIATSDGRYKENVQPVSDALNVINALNPVTFNWKQHPVHAFDTQTPAIGFIAQEVQQALADKPYLDSIVKSNEVTLPDETKEEFLGLAEGALIPVLVKALQELKAELDATKAEVAALKGA